VLVPVGGGAVARRGGLLLAGISYLNGIGP
jgi:hypothetical protein